MEIIITYLIYAGIAFVVALILIALSLPLIESVLNDYEKAKIEREIRPLIPQIKKALKEFNNLFKPDKRVSLGHKIAFMQKYKSLTNSIHELLSQEKYQKFNPVLDYFGVYKYLSLEDAFLDKTIENNKIYDSIQSFKNQEAELRRKYNYYLSPSHYFTYSEFESANSTISKLDSLLNKLKYSYICYLGEEANDLAVIKRDIDYCREKYNKKFIQNELTNNKSYFDTVLGEYPLDSQQRDSIVKLEDNCLVIASAGSGKTSTIQGKVKYLVEKRNIEPSKILLITYTKKAANELHSRIKIDGITSCTFHKLAKDIIAKVTGRVPTICDSDLPLNIFHSLIKTNESFLHAVNNYIINQQSLMGLEHDYNDAFTYFEDRKKYGIQAQFLDMDGKIIFTRSEEEKRLVSILTMLGVSFRYENPYEYDTTTSERRQYKPDFTIYYQDNQGREKRLYLEHFAIDSLGNVPQWFGDGTRGGWREANRSYNNGIDWKRRTHLLKGTTLIETTSANFRNGTVENVLKEQLCKYGVPINERSDEELYDMLAKRRKSLERSVYNLILSFITLMKANEKTVDGLLQQLNSVPVEEQDIRSKTILTDIIKPFYEEYENTLSAYGEIDFTDAIIQATELCRKGLWQHYDYILVDEFQDISVDRYKFLQALRGEGFKTKLFCVGDDWQSIFRFSGSDMSLVYEFEKYFGYTEHCKIETTYRFHQPLIDKSSEFIMKNKEQKEKSIKSPVGDIYKTYLNFVKCDCDEEDAVLKKVKEIVETIPSEDSILLLGRYNYDAASVGYKGSISDKDKQMTVNIGDRNLPFLSVHSAKGLEADHVILVNCNQGAFPSIIEDDPILDFVLSKSEAYPFAEERRLFYVAMTRAKKSMFILYDQKRPSPFIGEFLLRIERGSYLCPRCLEGKMVVIKEGKTTNGDDFRSFACSNNGAGCDFFETKFGDLTPPGIRITEEMTSQDIERLREERRRESKQHVRVIIPPAPFAPPPPEPQGSADDLPF
jgi:DNA helicase-4